MSLTPAGSHDQWGLKPGEDESFNSFGLPSSTNAKADSLYLAPGKVSNLRLATAERGSSQRLVPAVFVQTHASSGPSPLPAAALPEAIFERLSNALEKQFYRESTPNQRRAILERFADNYHRKLAGRPFPPDTIDEDRITTEQLYKATAPLPLLDAYNLSGPKLQCEIAVYGYPRWIEFEMGIKLSAEQEERAARTRASSHSCF